MADEEDINSRGLLGRLKSLADLRDALLAAAAGLYIFGYVVWSLHAARHRLGLLPALQSQYIIAGFYAALIVLAMVGMAFAVSRLVLRLIRPLVDTAVERVVATRPAHARSEPRESWIKDSISLLSSLGAITAALASVINRLGLAVPGVVLFAGAIVLVLVMTLASAKRDAVLAALGKTFEYVPIVVVSAGFCVGLFLLWTFVVYVFPLIPREFGGVRPECAYLDLTRNQLSADTVMVLVPTPMPGGLDASPSPVATAGPVGSPPAPQATATPLPPQRTTRVEVLFSGPDSMLVRPYRADTAAGAADTARTYEIKKTVIQAVIGCTEAEESG